MLDKVPGVPCVVSVKDNHTHPGLLHAQTHHANRILVVDHGRLVADPHGTMRRVFSFLGLDWDPSYLSMRGFVQQLALAHGKCGAERIAAEFAFSPGAHTIPAYAGITRRHQRANKSSLPSECQGGLDAQ